MKFVKLLNFKDFYLNENLVWKVSDSETEPKYKVNDEVIYLYQDKSIDDWKNLSDDDKKRPDRKPARKIVGIKKIKRIEGDKIFFDDKDGKEFSKGISDIIKKVDRKK